MSMYDFNADEIFIMAERIEKNGYAFYKKAADTIQDEDGKKFLLELAEMEKQHESTFAGMKGKLGASEKAPTVFADMKEIVEYCQITADMHVFNDNEISESNLEMILRRAITAEKDTIVFFTGMRDLVPEGFGKSKVEEIIREEMDHIRILSRKLAEIKRNK